MASYIKPIECRSHHFVWTFQSEESIIEQLLSGHQKIIALANRFPYSTWRGDEILKFESRRKEVFCKIISIRRNESSYKEMEEFEGSENLCIISKASLDICTMVLFEIKRVYVRT